MVAQLDRELLRVAPGRAASRLLGYAMFEGRPATTSGRWWNPVVFGHLRLAAHLPGRQVDRPVFIVGMGRSGTTLLGRILASHPSVGFLNEPKALWHLVRDDEDIIGSYAQPHRTGRLHLSAAEADAEAIRRGRALFSWYLRASRSQRVVDKYPELVFRHSFVRAIFPDARFLVAVRSPWATLRSVARWSDSHATGDSDWWGVRDQKWKIMWTQGVAGDPANCDLASLDLADERDDHVRAAIEWVVTMRAATSLAEVDPCAHVVDYDQLVRHPGEVVRDALDFCELPESPRTEAYARSIVAAPEGLGDDGDVVSPDSHLASPDGHLASPHGDLASPLPAALRDAIAQTWSQLQGAGRARYARACAP